MAGIDQVSLGETIYELVPEIAPLFDNTKEYAVGDCVIKDAVLYKFIASHAAGAWIGTDAEEVTVGKELTGLKADLKSAFETVKSMTVKCPLIGYGLTGLTYPAAGQVVGRSIQTDGVVVTSYYAATSNFFAVDTGNVVSANLVTDANNKHINTLIATYSGSTDSAFIERLALTAIDGTGIGDYVIPETVKYIRIVFIRPMSEAVQMTQTDIDTYFNATISGVGTEFNRIKAQSAQNQQAISAVDAIVTANENISILPVATYVDDKYAYNSNGIVTILTANTAGLFTIDVEKMRGYNVNVLAYILDNSHVILANASNEVLESASGTDALTISWTISDTAKYLYKKGLLSSSSEGLERVSVL